MWSAAALQPDLHRPIVLSSRRHHRLSLDDVVADRLLLINVHARLAGCHHGQAMPMIGSSYKHDLGLLLREQFLIVGIGRRLLLRWLPLRDEFRRFTQHLAIDITQPDDLDRRDLYQMK